MYLYAFKLLLLVIYRNNMHINGIFSAFLQIVLNILQNHLFKIKEKHFENVYQSYFSLHLQLK